MGASAELRSVSPAQIARVKDKACDVYGCGGFAELAALALSRQFLRKGRRFDARRILRAYLQKHPPTAQIQAAWAMTG